MSSDGTLQRLWIVCVACLLAGCAGVPTSPAGKNQTAANSSDKDEYEGWLFNSLMGRRAAESKPAQPPQPPPTPPDRPEAMPEEPGPWVPGPSSHGRTPTAMGSAAGPELIPAEGPIAGPPPTIPPELPAPSAEAVSIEAARKEAERKKGFELADLAPENIYKNLKNAAGYGPDEKIARAAMAEGRQLFREKKYKEAAAKFGTAAARWPDSPLEEDALFLKGESEFFADQYPKSHDTFGGLLKKYPNTRHLDTVVTRQFAIGRYWEQLYDAKPAWPVTPNLTDRTRPWFDAFGYAIQAYDRVRLNDPTGPLADDSVMATANAYFRRGQYENAAYHYDLLRKDYPNSEHQALAHVLGLQAKMRVYQGTMYIGQPLDDAERIATQALKQYGEKLGPERQRVAQARAQIIEEKANREFALGKYYEQKQHYGAARIYYQSVIDEYPTTEKAQAARERLEAIHDKPATPPSRLGWLTGMFEPKTR